MIAVQTRRLTFRFCFAACVLFAAPLITPPAAAELTDDQKKAVSEIAGFIREARSLYQSGDYEMSAEKIDAAAAGVAKLLESGDPEVYDSVEPAFSLIINAHALLELEGVVPAPFSRPARPAGAKSPAAKPQEAPDEAKPAAEMTASAESSPAEPSTPASRRTSRSRSQPEETGPSFAKQVAPILVEHCGRCHIQKSSGRFNMATFALLAKGPPEGRVIFPGDVAASRLIEVIETGDMPRGPGKVSDAELQLLKDWVTAGAKYDARSPTIPLAALAASAPKSSAGEPTPQPAPERPGPASPTGDETVSFAKDVAPILLDNCNGCHIDANQTRGGLRMDNFAALMRGGDSGEIVLPRRAADSLLIKKLKGEEGARMPAGGRPPLSDEQIAMISTWIEEGAAFDGESPDQPLRIAASLAWAASASVEELSERRAETAKKNLSLVVSGNDTLEHLATESFFVVGNVSDSTIEAVSQAAKRALSKVGSFADPDVFRGRVTIHVLPRRYDYAEFTRMVESRSVPAQWQSHWRYDGIDAYVAAVVTSNDSDAAIEARLVGPLTSLAVAMSGPDVPRWFAEGVGRAATAKSAAREVAAVQEWNSGLPGAASTIKDGQQFVKNQLPPEQTDLIAYGLASTMLGRNQRRQYDALLKSLRGGKSFDDAFVAAFGGKPAEYVDRWKPHAAAGDGRRR